MNAELFPKREKCLLQVIGAILPHGVVSYLLLSYSHDSLHTPNVVPAYTSSEHLVQLDILHLVCVSINMWIRLAWLLLHCVRLTANLSKQPLHQLLYLQRKTKIHLFPSWFSIWSWVSTSHLLLLPSTSFSHLLSFLLILMYQSRFTCEQGKSVCQSSLEIHQSVLCRISYLLFM